MTIERTSEQSRQQRRAITGRKPSLLASRRFVDQFRSAAAHCILIAAGITFLIPFLWMLSTSLKTNLEVVAWPPVWIPHPPLWSNYPKSLTFAPFGTYTVNTAIIVGGSLLGTLISCPLVAYGFSRIEWRGRDIAFFIYLSTLMLPYQVTMIPLFIAFKHLGWVGTFLPLIVPSFFGHVFYVFLLRQFFLTIPLELSDAGRIDGAGELTIFTRIMLPLVRPALAVVALFAFLASYRDFIGPLIYLQDDSQFTISLGLQAFQREHFTEWQLLMAASTVTVLPIIILFFLAQRTFIQGIALTGVKG